MKTYQNRNYSNKNYGYYKKPFFKTKGFYILLIIILIVTSFIYWSIKKTDSETTTEQRLTDQEFSPNQAGKIEFVQGKVELKEADGSWQEIAENYQFTSDNYIKTSADSKAILSLPDGSTLRLAENAEIKIEQLGMSDITIQQLSGKVFHRPKPDSPAIYKVKSEKTEMIALGTGFNVLVTSHLTILTVTDSSVRVRVMDGDISTNTRTIQSGQQATINPLKENSIETEDITSTELLSDDWYAWNLEKDTEKNLALGIFSEALKLVITEPATAEFTTNENKFLLKGITEPGASIFVAGTEIDNNNGNFEKEIAINSGKNEMEVTVQQGNKISKKKLYITSTKEDETIKLSGTINRNEINLVWQADNLTDFNSFISLKSTTTKPTYPDAEYHKTDASTFVDDWNSLEEGTYYFRICALSAEDKCVAYSNNIELTIGEATNKIEGKIILDLTQNQNSVVLSWNIDSSMDSSAGFKTVIGMKENPTYPGNSYHEVNGNKRNDTWQNLDSGTFHFRACLLKDDQCILYSNDKTAVIEKKSGSISLSGILDGKTIILNWKAIDLQVNSGFKVYLSDSSFTPPTQISHTITDNSATSDKWELESGTYFFRVCENSNDSCGTTSNEISITIP